jgi:hypothetical protein
MVGAMVYRVRAGREGIRTGEDNDDSDADADGVVDITHNSTDDCTCTREKDNRTLVKILANLKMGG